MSAAGSSYESLADDTVRTFGPPSRIPPLGSPVPPEWTVLKGMSSGSHVDVSDVIFLPVTAFRIEPESKGSHLTVDGELIEHSAIQAEIFPSMANVFARSQ
ncbi:unnamed protein product [Nesidiocoris tenuis]|uniref:Uncharacterized protein n=1 Tax=Nesidiocoris tenuis TaxID=355587 RepID=A0A6H5H0W8_9HEMI|nr:unnamed protein product [Nesidiocoris tenuis]